MVQGGATQAILYSGTGPCIQQGQHYVKARGGVGSGGETSTTAAAAVFTTPIGGGVGPLLPPGGSEEGGAPRGIHGIGVRPRLQKSQNYPKVATGHGHVEGGAPSGPP